MGYHGNHETRVDLLGFPSSQEIHELGAGGGPFDCRDYYGDGRRQRIRQLCAEWSREFAQVDQLPISATMSQRPPTFFQTFTKLPLPFTGLPFGPSMVWLYVP